MAGEIASFADLKNVKVGDVERPKPVPIGHYVSQFTGMMKEHKAKSKNLAMRFPFKLVAPADDVDQAELEAAGGIPDKEFALDFWMSPDARWRFTEFGKAMGHSDQLGLLELAEALATAGDPFLIEVYHEVGENAKPEDPPFMRFQNPTPVSG